MEKEKQGDIREEILLLLEKINEVERDILSLYYENGELTFKLYKNNLSISEMKLQQDELYKKLDSLELKERQIIK